MKSLGTLKALASLESRSQNFEHAAKSGKAAPLGEAIDWVAPLSSDNPAKTIFPEYACRSKPWVILYPEHRAGSMLAGLRLESDGDRLKDVWQALQGDAGGVVEAVVDVWLGAEEEKE